VYYTGSIWLTGNYGVGYNGSTIFPICYSYDGISWFGSTSSGTIFIGNVPYITGFSSNSSIIVAISNSNIRIGYSYDGITWFAGTYTSINSGFTNFAEVFSSNSGSVTFNGQQFVITVLATQTNANLQLVTSTDGKVWQFTSTTISSASSTVLKNYYSRATLPYQFPVLGPQGNSGSQGATGSQGIIGSQGVSAPIFTVFSNQVVLSISTGLYYSDDCLTWNSCIGNGVSLSEPTAVNAPRGNTSIAFNGSMWVSSTGRISTSIFLAYSTDAHNWYPCTGIPSGSNCVQSIAWNGSIWVALSLNINATELTIYRSSDGINWTSSGSNLGGNTSVITANTMCSVVWGGVLCNRFVAVFGAGAPIYSSDGINWTRSTSTVFAGRPYTVYYTGSIWLSGNSTSTSNSIAYNNTTSFPICYSYDGISWFGSTSSGSIFTGDGYRPFITGFSSNNSIIVAISMSTTYFGYSYDGINWVAGNSPTIYTSLALDNDLFANNTGSVIFDGNRFVVTVGQASRINTFIPLVVSTDGISWFVSYLPIAATGINGPFTFNYYPRLILPYLFPAQGAVGAQGVSAPINTVFNKQALMSTTAGLYYADDGIAWALTTANGISFTGAWGTQPRGNTSIAFNGSIWLCSSSNSNVPLAYSTDAHNWYACVGFPSSASNYVFGLAWNGSIWVAIYSISSSVVMYRSSNGITWTSIGYNISGNTSGVSFPNSYQHSVAWGGVLCNRFVAVFSSGAPIYSSDGINWTRSTSTVFAGSPYTVYYTGSIWLTGNYGVGYNGSTIFPICYSYDGISWFGSTSSGSIFTSRGDGYTPFVTGFSSNSSIIVAISCSTTRIGYSYDGITWFAGDYSSVNSASTDFNANGFSSNSGSVTFNGEQFIITSTTTTPNANLQLITSSNGKTWQFTTTTVSSGSSTVLTKNYYSRATLPYQFSMINSTVSNITVAGTSSLQQLQRAVVSLSGATGAVSHDWSSADIFYHTSIAANFTCNIINIPTVSNKSYEINLILSQGASAYLATALQISGSAVSLLWAGGSAPTPTANKTGKQRLELYYSGSAWTAMSTYVSFG